LPEDSGFKAVKFGKHGNGYWLLVTGNWLLPARLSHSAGNIRYWIFLIWNLFDF
jgi:hypothetical protein